MNKIQRVGIIGSGKMGSDIFNYLSDFSFELIWYTRNSDHKNILYEAYQKKVKRQLKHGIISDDIFELRNSYKITDQLSDLSDCDLIIESIIEDQTVKIELFKRLDQIVKPSSILVSNSSSILPSIYCQDLLRKNRVAGIHFFYPIAIKNITEIIFSETTDEITRESIKLFLQSINRFYIEQDEKSAFILNRFLLEIQIKAFEVLAKYGLDYSQIDQIAIQIIPDFGLFEMMDQVGHNTMQNAIMNYSLMDTDKRKYQPLLNELINRNEKAHGKDSSGLFCDQKIKETIMPDLSYEIQGIFKEHVQGIFNRYSEYFDLNIFIFKKALFEYCGIML